MHQVRKSSIILVPPDIRDRPLRKMSLISTVLRKVLRGNGYQRIGDLHGLTNDQVLKQWGSSALLTRELEELKCVITRLSPDGERGDNCERENELEHHIAHNASFISTAESADILDRSVDELALSVRGYNCLRAANIRTVRQLVRQSEKELLSNRNLGLTTLYEIKELLHSMNLQLGCEPNGRDSALVERSSGTVSGSELSNDTSRSLIIVPQSVRGWSISLMPISARLSGVLERMGVQLLGDLQGMSFAQVAKAKNCGRTTLAELRVFVRSLQVGEFDIANASVEGVAAAYTIRLVDETIGKLPSRTREILLLRFGGKGEDQMTLEEIGRKYDLTRERVRQIVDTTIKQMHKSGRLAFGDLLKKIAEKCITAVCPLTPALLTQWVSVDAGTSSYPMSFYIRLFNELLPEIPGWPEHQKPAGTVGRSAEIVRSLRELMREDIRARPLQEAFEKLRADIMFSGMKADEFLDALRRDDSLTVEFAHPDRPEVRPSKLRTREWVRHVLSQADCPLTPEEIIRQGCELLGDRISPPSPFTLANVLRPENGFYWLDRHAVGLRQHFRLQLSMWDKVRSDFAQLLKDENRPISTSEICNEERFNWTRLANAYEIAQVLREDHRFVDLGRFLFGLTTWGIDERAHVNDLIPKVLNRIGHPMTAAEVSKELMRFRSVTATSMSAFLQKSGDIRDYGFGYYGLKMWGDDATSFLVSEAPFVNRIIARSAPPFTFGALCKMLDITADSRLADRLWRTIQYLPKVRVDSETQTAGTLLSHKSWSLERALYTVLGRADQPLPAYEIQWKLNECFDSTFSDRSLTQIENCLGRSSLFVRNASGEYLLNMHVEDYALDVGSIRQTCLEVLSSCNEVVGCDDLLERIGAEGIEDETLSPSILAALLRGDEVFEEVGTNRFRARP